MNGIGYYYAASGALELIRTQGQARIYPRHMHTRHWIAGLVRLGGVFLATDTNARYLHAGRHFCIPPYASHSLRIEPGSALLVICVDGRSIFSAYENLFSLRHAHFRQADERAWMDALISGQWPNVIWGPCPQTPTKVTSPFGNPSIAEPLSISACTGNILPDERNACRQPAQDSLLLRSVREVTRRILENPADELRSDQMAAYAGYSQWHFLRAFRNVMQMNPHAFQVLCRLRLLRSMLRSDTASAAAAVSAGFADQSHMHKVFKRHHGMTPGEFRKSSFRLEL